MLPHKINSPGEGLVETATLPFSLVHIVLEKSLLVVNEGLEEVACVPIANGRPETTSLVGEMASGGTHLTFDPSNLAVNKSLPCREMARIHLPTSDATIAINIINVLAITHRVPIAPFFTPEVSGLERLKCHLLLLPHYTPWPTLRSDATACL
jgi:hypothetical protein